LYNNYSIYLQGRKLYSTLIPPALMLTGSGSPITVRLGWISLHGVHIPTLNY